MLAKLFPARAERKNAHLIYYGLVTKARTPFLYADLGVPDTIDGRFDLILLHLFMVDKRLEAEGAAYVRLRRFIQEAMVRDMDRSFRELGVGDMSVSKEMKKVGAAWLGRRSAYEEATAEAAAENALMSAIEKNIFRGEKATGAGELADYVKKTILSLAELTFESPRSCVLFPATE